jgi:predicted Fe-S protein YdhL (DUF1289 family)
VSETIKTPCVGLCEIRLGSPYCVGCRRSGAEIGAWTAMSDEDRELIMYDLQFRKVGTQQ